MPDLAALLVAILANSQVKMALAGLAKTGKNALIRRLAPTSREKAAERAIEIFVCEWNKEMEACTFEFAQDGWRDQLQRLVMISAAEIADWMSPESPDIDLSPIASCWVALGLDELPDDFSWPRIAQNYAREIKLFIKRHPELRAEYDTVLRERTAKASERAAAAVEVSAGLERGFDLAAYRRFLIENKCNALQLAALHTSTYDKNNKLVLWSVFVEPSARESIPFVDIPPEYLRLLRQEGHLPYYSDEEDINERQARYTSCPVCPVFEILRRERLTVVTGDPGSGKTSLLKYRALQWAKSDLEMPLPLLIDLKQYVKVHNGLLHYSCSGLEVYRMAISQVESLLEQGDAAFYLDGLDEIFDVGARSSVVEEIAVLSSKYGNAKFIVTSRKLGYDPGRLTAAGFLHATIEDFDQAQIIAFLERWYTLAEADKTERDLLQNRMKKAIKESHSICELAGNPLLMTMMAILNRNQELPRNRVALYKEASRVLLDEWDTRKALSTSEFDRHSKEAFLRELAADLQGSENGNAGNLIEHSWLLEKIQVFLDTLGLDNTRTKAVSLVMQLTERNFILSYAGADRFCFVHRTFLEYYCASWFVKRFQAKQELSFEDLRDKIFGNHWRDKNWHQVLQLIAGMIEPKHAGMLIEFLITQNSVAHEGANLFLAAGCLNEVRRRRELEPIDEALWRELTTVKIRASNLYQDDEPFRIRKDAVRAISSNWREEKAFPWLLDQARNSRDESVRLVALEELSRGWAEEPQTLPLIQEHASNDEDFDIRRAMIRELALGWPDDPETLRLIKVIRQHDKSYFVRDFAEAWLARTWPGVEMQ